MKKKNFYIFILFLIFTNCGFKLANIDNNYKITEINTTGENQINFKLKNKLSFSSPENNKNDVKLEIDSKKSKNIKEKNISNQINKYEIRIEVKVKFISSNKVGNFTISKNGDYNVSNIYSETLNREKNVTNTLINEILEEIIENLNLNFNDS